MTEDSGFASASTLDELSDVSLELERINDLAEGVAKTLTGAFRSAILEGRPLRTLLADIGRSFADIALKAALKPVGGLISGLIENLFSATNPALANPQPFAKGGVIASPSYFSLGSGKIGLAGEKGPEAILPLVRGSDGRLGVAGNAPSSVTVNFNVTARDANSFKSSEAEISAMLLRAVKRGTRAS